MEKENQNITIRSISGDASEEEFTAIAAAINLYFRGGYEEHKLTIKHSSSSAWNSKIFGINKLNK
ncbi:MAG: hypothetical protein MJ198_01145 [Bacteroidales bacterium]|nr:hypothetical protein [Bacteroidales bacterium]